MTERQSPREMHEALVTIATDLHRRLYERTQNPVHVWAAYVQARQLKATTLPAWMLAYFDEAAARLIAPAGTENPDAIVKALALHTPRGGASARTRAAAAKRDSVIRGQIDQARARGKTVTDAIQDVAEQVGLSYERVRAINYSGGKGQKRRGRGRLLGE